MASMDITVAEKMAIDGLQLRVNTAQGIFNAELGEVGRQDKLICEFICERVGLPTGAIGSTHRINKDKWVVEEIEQPPVTPEE